MTSPGGEDTSKPVPVLLTVRELDHGGVERDVSKIAIHLDRRRFEPHVASYRAHGLRYEELRDAGVPILHLPVSSLKSPAAAAAAVSLLKYLWTRRIRIVHAFDPSAALTVPLARFSGIPVVLSSQLGYRDLFDRRTRWQLRWTDRIVDAMVVNCEAMRRHLIQDEGVPAARIELCYNGVDTREFCPAEARKPGFLADASLVIGTICVLRPEKALDVLQEAFARIRHLRAGLKLLIVGSGPELPRLQENSARLGIQEQSIFVPSTARVADYLRAIDVFVLCSNSEAFSNALLEAMACGCCAAGSRVGGTPELLGCDERGLLFEVGNSGDLAEKLTRLISDQDLRRSLAGHAAQFAKEKLNIGVAARRMAEIYEDQLRQKGSS